MSEKKSILDEIVSVLEGDTPQETGKKIIKSGIAAFKTQVASKDGSTMDLENAVDDAKKAVRLSLANNGQLMTSKDDREAYVQNWINAEKTLEKAEKELTTHNKWLEKMKSMLAELENG